MPDIDDSPYRPYTLWFETLPSGKTAQVYLVPRTDSCGVVGHWNGQVRRVETMANRWEAEQLGWQWFVELHSPPKKPELKPEPKEPVSWTPPGLMWAT